MSVEDLGKGWIGREKAFADDTVIQEKSHKIAERLHGIGLVADEIIADKRTCSADSKSRLYWEKSSWVHWKDKEVGGKTQPEPKQSSDLIQTLVAEPGD